MKNKIGYVIFVLLLFGLVYYCNSRASREFEWYPTYSEDDKNPFGGYVFDKILSKSWKEGYSHSYYNIKRLIQSGELSGQNLLIVTHDFQSYKLEIDDLLNYVDSGHQVMIVADYFDRTLRDTLSFQSTLHFSFFDYLENDARQRLVDLRFCTPELKNNLYAFPDANVQGCFTRIDTARAVVIAEDRDSAAVAVRYPVGKGNLILVVNPKIFTNYGILDEKNNEYLFTMLSYLKGAPLLRTEYYQIRTRESESPFRYILSSSPLKWAFYLTIAAIVLFMIFTAKRKQKAIPVIRTPENKMQQFIYTLADLYLRRNNNADIVRKKYTYWAENLKREYGIDIINRVHDYEFYSYFSSKTGKEIESVRSLFNELDVIDEDTVISDTRMIELIQKMTV